MQLLSKFALTLSNIDDASPFSLIAIGDFNARNRTGGKET